MKPCVTMWCYPYYSRESACCIVFSRSPSQCWSQCSRVWY
nr:MAG TPA: hypothetical protein [Caudoviricetes sp.]